MNNTPESSPTPAPEDTPQRSLLSRLLRKGAIAVAVLAVLAAVFYLEENWRGKSAWETTKNRLEAQHEKLDWADYIPPAVADDQNFFKAPGMAEWFAGSGTNDLVTRLSPSSFAAEAARLANGNASVVVAELLLRPPGSDVATPGVDAPPAKLLAEVSLDKVPLSEAVSQLAQQAGLKVQIDPAIVSGRPQPNGKAGPLTYVTGRWTNVSALSVLMALQCNQNLRWMNDSNTGLSVIKDADVANSAGGGDSANRDFVLATIRFAIGPVGEIADGIPLSGVALRQNPPRRLSVAPDSVPTHGELARLLPGTNGLQIEPAGDSLRVLLTHVPVPAADYLAWSDQFSPEFDKIREALKRPAVRLGGDYQQLYEIPTPNVTAIRTVATRLSSRAMACLMRGQTEQALRELTLLRDLRGCLEGRPAGKAVTLTTAMTDAAITALYAETIDYGLKLQIWRDPEIVALQDQLSGIDLVSVVWNTMESERAEACRLLESASRSEVADVLGVSADKTGLWQKITSPSLLALQFMPRGWIFRNQARLAEWDQKMIDSVDRFQGIVHPHQADGDNSLINDEIHHRTLYSYLAKSTIHLMGASLKTVALNQTRVNQALVVCALERFRLAHGEYPATLHDLAPQFISVLPLDPVNGEPFKYHFAGGHFLLYSIGWDEKDNDGATLDAQGDGDWVWGRF